MKTKLIPLLCGACLLWASAAQSQTPRPPGARWKPFTSREGAFRVLMPGAPKAKKTVEKDRDGATINHDFTFETRTSLFMVGYQEHPPQVARLLNADALLDEVSKGATSDLKDARIVGKKKIALSGFPGREIRMASADGVMTLRIYWVKRRLYQIMAALPKTAAKDGERFLNSFVLTAK